MANRITNYQLLGLFIGGEDGNVRQDADAVGTADCHMIKVLVDGTTFSVISVINQAGATVDMLDVNNLTAKTWSKGDLVFAPFGGYFTAYTADEETEYYIMPGSDRIKQLP